VRHRGPRAASSEAETRPRGCQALERDGESPEGVLDPRARRRIARGGARPSSETEFTRRGARSSSEAGTRPRETAADRLVGRGPFHFGPRPYGVCFRFVGIFVCVLLSFRKGGFPWLLGALMVVPDKRDTCEATHSYICVLY
jgi:hypothetical protein